MWWSNVKLMFSAENRGCGCVYARTGSCAIALFPLTILLLALLGSMFQFPLYAQSSRGGAETHVGLGYEALKRDQYEEAAAEFRAALALDPNLVLRARFPLAVALFEGHKSQEARKEFEALRAAV